MLPQLHSALLSERFAKLNKEHGVEVLTGLTVERFTGRDKVEGAVLGDGRVLACDLAVVATGVEPNCAFLACRHSTPARVAPGTFSLRGEAPVAISSLP
jgi:NADPH-dependent 2,4-dienoyl-CoA reductase/sulfur reductase-like enzyme